MELWMGDPLAPSEARRTGRGLASPVYNSLEMTRPRALESKKRPHDLTLISFIKHIECKLYYALLSNIRRIYKNVGKRANIL